MIKGIAPILICIIFIASCKSKPGEADIIKDTTPVVKANISLMQCYSRIQKRDTITLKLRTTDSLVDGNLDYKIYQKDQNKGEIKGIVKGDTILADYTFLSEGTTSVREVIFLKKGTNLVEGFGDVEEINGKMVFKKDGKLSFNDNMTLTVGPCN